MVKMSLMMEMMSVALANTTKTNIDRDDNNENNNCNYNEYNSVYVNWLLSQKAKVTRCTVKFHHCINDLFTTCCALSDNVIY